MQKHALPTCHPLAPRPLSSSRSLSSPPSSPPAHSLTVHLVPHTHDDVGWLQTVDQYYVALRAVHPQHRHPSSCTRDPSRRFMYVEQAFFQRWWRQQSPAMQAHDPLSWWPSGQLEFVNGAWAMHDEGCTHFVDMIDQTTLGHRVHHRRVRPRSQPHRRLADRPLRTQRHAGRAAVGRGRLRRPLLRSPGLSGAGGTRG